jgi:tetratricopeptide (TPR) repeat protein
MKLCRETGALESVAWCKFTLAEIAKQCGRLDEAAELYKDARELSPPDTPQLANAVMNLGDIAMRRGQYRQAERYFQEGLAAFQARRVDWGVINTLENLGLLACTERRYPEAKQYFERALDLALGARRLPLVVNLIASFARYHRDRGQLERASELLGWAQQHSALHHQTRARCIEPLLCELGQASSSAELEAALARGGALELDVAVQKALELPGY